MARPELTVIDQRQVVPGRYRSLLRLNDHGRAEVCWFVSELDRIVDCGVRWDRAVELLARTELPARARAMGRSTHDDAPR